MTSGTVERPGRWALPPEPPETWVGKNATAFLVILAAMAAGVPGLVLLPGTGLSTYLLATVYAAGGLLSLGNAYLLLLQATVTQDRRLLWASAGCATLLAIYVVRSGDPAVPGQPADDHDLRLAAALSVAWLLTLPVTALTSGLRRLGMWLFLVPLAVLAAAAYGAYQAPLVRVSDVRVTVRGREVLLACAVVGVLAAFWWRQRVPKGNRGPWGWVGAALMLTPLVAVLRGFSLGRHDPTSWPALAVELVTLLVPFLGLYVLCMRGYLKQAHRWRQLEAEVRRLRASSALLPGLSITPDDDAGLPERHEVRELIARADNQVALQPVYDLATLTVVGQEALARFGGRVPTDRWFRAAGLHGLASELELLTLARALSTLPGMAPDQFLAINASPAALHDDKVLELLEASDLSRLIIEITEHDAVNDYGLTREALAVLRSSGARIAVDDVGAGFASLRHVLLLQPDVVKLDTSLTRDVHDNQRQQAIVRALVTFTAEVGATVLAEGIEVAEQISALLDAGVALGQGWHLGVPVQQGILS
ncbi:MAG: response regulator receiver modulated diguanylate phosphodiesterase [Frankiales bacterium]|nr:response regulator receiver modulated diguanylate phosphodiesterase [Frankiales bacterium]